MSWQRFTLALSLVLSGTGSATAPDEKFVPPNLNESGRVGCFVEADDGTHLYADSKVFAQYVGGRVDYSAVIARRSDPKQLFLDCSQWFREMAEEFPKKK